MISFAGKVKNELCRVGIGRQCCARAEGYGVLLYGNTFTPGEIRIITENGDFAARLPKLFQKAFGVKFDRVPEETNGKGKLIFGITAPEKLRQTAALRLEYPELSLVQLAEKCDPPVTKSCMNHRMRKLMEEAKEL